MKEYKVAIDFQTVSEYTPTKFDSAEDKAKFVAHFKRFVSKGMKETMFPKWFYTQLSMTFGHIAHYNKAGFYEEWFSSPERKRDFIQTTLNYYPIGDPACTYSDAERNIVEWLRRELA